MTDQAEQKSYFSDHPYTPDRVANLEQVVAKLQWENNEMHDISFSDQLDGLVFSENPVKGLFVENTFLHPDIDFSVAFPKGWTYFNKYNAAGAVNEKQDAFVYITMEDTLLSPKKKGTNYIKEVKKMRRKLSIKGESATVNGNEAYMVTVSEQVQADIVYAHFIWILVDGNMYKLTGVKTGGFKEAMKNSATSIHSLTAEEKDKVRVKKVLYTDILNDEESLETISTRTENELLDHLLFPLNGLESSAVLKKGDAFKVIKEYAYFE